MSKSPDSTRDDIREASREAEPAGVTKPIVGQRGSGWVKFLRIVFYVLAIPLTAVGAGLIKSATMSSTYLDGTHAARLDNGYIIFGLGLAMLIANAFWGILRWFLRGCREQWRTWVIIGKLIGGGIWRSLVMVPLFLLGLFVLTPLVVDTIYNNTVVAESEPYDIDYAEHRLEYLTEHLDEFSPQAVYDELSELMLANIEFDPDAVNQSTARSGFTLPFETPVYARTTKVSSLTDAVLSPNGNFVIFYTTTGDDAITDADATRLAGMFEEIIAGYQNNLGFEYKYEKYNKLTGSIKDNGIQKVLQASGIDKNILDTAMPVYVADPYSEATNTLASYAGKRWLGLTESALTKLGSLMDIDATKLYDSAPSVPFVNILPKNVNNSSLSAVTAHELGHHYAAVYNDEHYGKTGSDDDFIDETGPNWMAINALKTNPADGLINDNHYNYAYLQTSTRTTISLAKEGFPGYPAVAFLQNYYEIVPEAKTKIMDAIYYGDALNYLYEQAGRENFAKVMTQLAERNLTGDYGGKLANRTLPQGEELYCTDICTHTYRMAAASTQYIYMTPDEYTDAIATFSTNESWVTASVVAQTARGGWQVVAPAANEVVIDFTEDEWRQYPVVALAISNASISVSGIYSLDITMADLEHLLTDLEDFELDLTSNEIIVELGDGCYRINMESVFDMIERVMGLGSQFLNILSQFDESGHMRNIQNQYEAEMSEVQSSLNTARAEISPYRITFCINQVASGQSFDAVKARLQAALRYNINIINTQQGGERMSAFVGFDMLARRGRGYVLIQSSDGEMGLITINIDPK